MKSFLILLSILIFNNSFSQPSWFKETVKNSKDYEVNPDAPAITLLDYGEVEISDNMTAKLTLRTVYKILTQKGEDHGTFTFPGNPTRKLKKLKGWIYKNDGTFKSLNDNNIMETSSFEDAMYYDQSKTTTAILPGVEPGVIVGFEYEVKEEEWTSLFQGFVFQDKLPVKLVKYIVKIPEKWKLIKSEWNLDGITFEHSNERYIWEGKNLPFRPYEPLSPSSDYLSKRLFITTYDSEHTGANQFKNWDEVGIWCYNLFKDQTEPNAEMIKTVNEITKGLVSSEDKIKAIAEFIQKEIRYVAIEIGKGRWKPREAQLTFENRYGDCKDKTTLMCALLKTIDITSYPVLINANYSIDEQVPSPFQFDHVILGIPVDGLDLSESINDGVIDGYLFFDPTSESTPFGELPPQLLGRKILLGAPSDSLLGQLNFPEPQARRTVNYLNGELFKDGSFTAKITTANFDVMANNEKSQHRYLSLDKQKKEWEKKLSLNIPVFNISNFETYDRGDSAGVFFELTGSGLTQISGDLILLKPDLLTKSEPNPLSNPERIYPIWLGVSKQQENNISWKVPDSFIPLLSEDYMSKKFHECSVDLNLKIQGKQLKLETKRIIMNRLIDKEEYNDVAEFTEALSHLYSYLVFYQSK